MPNSPKPNRGKYAGLNKKPGKPRGFVRDDPVTPENKKRNVPICGAQRTGKSDAGAGICCMTAGWGTDHLGTGHCKLHGGTTEAHSNKAVREAAVEIARRMGEDKDISPGEALMQELHRSAGAVEWLRWKIQEMESDDFLMQRTMNLGMQPGAWLQMYNQERAHLLRVSKAALDAGVAERQVRIAEQQAAMMAMVMKAVIDSVELDLTPRQRSLAPKVFRRALVATAGELEFEEAEIVE